MLNIIKNGVVINNDSWTLIEKDVELIDIESLNYIVVPLKLWQQHKEQLAPLENIGVWLDSDEPAYHLAQDIEQLPLVAINFPVFSDGRGYSYAETIRRDGFKGELRAIGDILKDQLYFYKRVGFNSFALRADINAEEALTHLTDFAETYQVSHSHPTPLFKRR
ncbi:uncharacterized protein (DUF934 family) [Sinobacterium caligoides]|uniref:Uncharacterized protein (DUF934 family) n=1 Tax=Sinobacterium caligoides TaxID=933926 RepID=A0A3N2DJN6_9GAMM|nr:DUF934 domain-containing protein [Sinobacterium caligoides]ROS00011.1 uncharacterized protein (DUF934 family) [Sinobacterium caligoides]